MSTSVLLVDDHPIIRAALRNAFETISEDIVCTPAGSLEEAISAVSLSHPPDVVMLDLNLPDACGLATLHAFRRRYPGLYVVALCDCVDMALVQAVQTLKTFTVFPKTTPVDQLRSHLEQILANVAAFQKTAAARNQDAHAAEPGLHGGQPATVANGSPSHSPLPGSPLPSSLGATGGETGAPIIASQPPRIYQDGRHLGLTERQRCVLKLMMMGLPNKAICRVLHLAEGTVKVHVSAVLRALGVKSRAQVTLAALSCGIRMEAIVLPEFDGEAPPA